MLSRKVDGAALRAIREDRELTGVELGVLLGVDSSLIYKIEAGVRQPSAKLLGRLCRTLAVNKADLLIPDPEEKAS